MRTSMAIYPARSRLVITTRPDLLLWVEVHSVMMGRGGCSSSSCSWRCHCITKDIVCTTAGQAHPIHLLQSPQMPVGDLLQQRFADPQPHRQVHAVLGPRKDPGDGPQRLHAPRLPLGGAAPQVHGPQQRRDGHGLRMTRAPVQRKAAERDTARAPRAAQTRSMTATAPPPQSQRQPPGTHWSGGEGGGGGGLRGGGGVTLLLDNCSMKGFGHCKQWLNGNSAESRTLRAADPPA